MSSARLIVIDVVEKVKAGVGVRLVDVDVCVSSRVIRLHLQPRFLPSHQPTIRPASLYPHTFVTAFQKSNGEEMNFGPFGAGAIRSQSPALSSRAASPQLQGTPKSPTDGQSTHGSRRRYSLTHFRPEARQSSPSLWHKHRTNARNVGDCTRGMGGLHSLSQSPIEGSPEQSRHRQSPSSQFRACIEAGTMPESESALRRTSEGARGLPIHLLDLRSHARRRWSSGLPGWLVPALVVCISVREARSV